MLIEVEQKPSLTEIPRAQRRAVTQPLADFEANNPRKEAMVRAYLSSQHAMAAIAKHFGVHYSTVSSRERIRKKERSMLTQDLTPFFCLQGGQCGVIALLGGAMKMAMHATHAAPFFSAFIRNSFPTFIWRKEFRVVSINIHRL